MPRIELERVEQSEDSDEYSTESFDRIAFAERAIALIKPPKMRVAICGGTRRVNVSSGRQWGASPGSRWAMVSVPYNASRAAIARAVLALHEGEGRPWVLDVLVSKATSVYRG